jgi:phosphoadenosine phosphosulfate reductase
MVQSVRNYNQKKADRELEAMIIEAILFIRRHEPPEGYFVSFSGGKDSIVSLHLAYIAGVRYQAFFINTGIDPPPVVTFIREHYPEVRFLYPRYSFFEGIRRNSPPLRNRRWCCELLKKVSTANIPLKHRIIGNRKEESVLRFNQERVDYQSRYRFHLYRPIHDWKEWAVWQFIERYQLPYPSLYDEGWSRIGCVVCPYICTKNMVQINRNRERWPGIFNAFEHAVADWFHSRQARGKVFQEASAEEYIQKWYRAELYKPRTRKSARSRPPPAP